MSEYEVLSLLESHTDQQTQLIIQAVSLHFAPVVAAFFFCIAGFRPAFNGS